jgi:hypothetical protein
MHFTVSDYMLDIVHNAIQAGSSTVEVDVAAAHVAEADNQLVVEVRDNGSGMTSEQLKRITDPFYTDGVKHPGRKVGLGIPFLAQVIDAVDGELCLDSTPGHGTRVRFAFDEGHIDAPPLGDLVECFAACMGFDGEYELIVQRFCDAGSYKISRSELREVLGDLSDVGARSLLTRYISSLETETCG